MQLTEEDGEVTFRNNRYVFRDKYTRKAQTFRGLGPLLREFFWPSYDYEKATRKANQTLREVRLATPKRDPLLYSKGVGGQDVGKKVHDQLDEVVSGRVQAHQLIDNPLMHPYVVKIVALLGQVQLVPVQTEYVVYDRSIRLATKIDMLCERKGDPATVVLIELKIGYPSVAWRLGNAQVHPFEEMCENSPFHQACLQVLMGKEMFQLRPHGYRRVECMVLHAAQDKVEVEPVPDYLACCSSELYEMMSRACTRNYYLGRPLARKRKRHAKAR